MRKLAALLATLTLSIALATAGCQPMHWAHRDCRHHGGLSHVTNITPGPPVAHCADGTRYFG